MLLTSSDVVLSCDRGLRGGVCGGSRSGNTPRARSDGGVLLAGGRPPIAEAAPRSF